MMKRKEQEPQFVSETVLRECAAVYDSLAPQYDLARFGNRAGRYEFEESRALVEDILSAVLAGRPKDWLALDVACGTGKIAVAVAQLGGSVVALDAAPGMLRRCAENSRAAGVEDRVTLAQASASNLPYENCSFDMIFCFRFLHLFPVGAYAGLLREMARVVKVGGYLVTEVKNELYFKMFEGMRGFLSLNPDVASSSSSVSATLLSDLARQVGSLNLQETIGLRLPAVWRLNHHGYPARVFRRLARGPLRFVSPYLIAIYRKVDPDKANPSI